MSMQSVRAVFVGAFFVAFGWIATPAHGDTPVDVVVRNVGPNVVKVRVAEGGARVGDAHQLWVGALATEADLWLKTGQKCVWVEQTLVDATGPWSEPEKFCRPEKCAGVGRAYMCATIEGAPLRIDVDGSP